MPSSRALTLPRSIAAIEKFGILLVYPVDNRPEPSSLWSAFFSDEMRWEWDAGGDDRVAKLWQLRTALSTSREVVYAKWYRGRATFFSNEIFTALLAYLGTARLREDTLSIEARSILELLEMDSPQSTKQIKLATDLRGKMFERVYEKAMKSLFEKLWTVGFGEVEDGAFPSLAVGSTHALFEDLWDASRDLSAGDAEKILKAKLGSESLFFKFAQKMAARS